MQEAIASSVSPVKDNTVDELRNAALGAARYSAVTAAVTSRCGGEGLANDSLIAAFSPACEAFRQHPDHQRCDQIILGTSHGVTLCRSRFGMWSAFTKTARRGTRASLSLELLGADFEGHAASVLGI